MSTLTLLTLPIGNLGDMTVRGRQCLLDGEVFLAEDTRTFRKLLNHLDISTSGKAIESFHNATAEEVELLVSRLNSGESLIVVSESGSPVICDPAFPLIRRAIESGHKIETIPGVSSLVAALELSGLPPYPFSFHGFLPREEGALIRFFKSNGTGTHIVFESPHRIRDSLRILCREIPASSICVAREMTKKFEEVVRFSAADVESIERVREQGETVIVYHIDDGRNPVGDYGKIHRLAEDVLDKYSAKRVAKLLGQILKRDSSEIYKSLVKNGRID